MVNKLSYTILTIIRFILNKNNSVYRPTEIQAFLNIAKENNIISKYGKIPKYTSFESKVYYLDMLIRSKEIPLAEKNNSIKSNDKVRVPIPIYEIANRTHHTSEYIQKIMNSIDDKAFLRDKFNIYPILPIISKVKV